MALPAGRYGVTKEQLRKIKRLPINTIGMITETKEGIAIIEDGAKASQLITAGRQFWHNGKLYSADTDIAKDVAIITSGEGKNATEMPNITDQLPGTDAEKANEVTIARVENGSNPTATINTGEQFYHLGILYTATTDIATTDTITPNTNCRVSDSVTEQIASLDAQKTDNSVIGNVENGATASQAYAVGEHFIRGGKFCTVTAAIALNDPLSTATNYKEGALGDSFWISVKKTGVSVTAGSYASILLPTIPNYSCMSWSIGAGGTGVAANCTAICSKDTNDHLSNIRLQNRDLENDHSWDIVLNLLYEIGRAHV